jgi:hypothetical protein
LIGQAKNKLIFAIVCVSLLTVCNFLSSYLKLLFINA